MTHHPTLLVTLLVLGLFTPVTASADSELLLRTPSLSVRPASAASAQGAATAGQREVQSERTTPDPDGAAPVAENGATSARSTGRSTRAWLELQRTPRDQSPGPRIPSEAAIRSYFEYLESFSHPIPVFFYAESQARSAGDR